MPLNGDDRTALVMEFRRHRALVARARKSAEMAAETLSLAEELSGDVEAELAEAILNGGDVEHDGRRYSVEDRDGISVVVVGPSNLAVTNNPGDVP